MRVIMIDLRQRLGRLGLLLFGLVLMGLVVGPLRGPAELLVAVMSGANKLKPIYAVDTPEAKIAISFDACWGAEHTPTLLAILKQHNIKTTFFLVNIWLEKYPELAKAIVAEGHELGLHSASHPDFAQLSEEQMEKELRENKEAIERITGFQPILFRPPFGSYNNTLIRLTLRMGLHPT